MIFHGVEGALKCRTVKNVLRVKSFCTFWN